MIEAAEIDELEEAMVLIVRRLFPKEDKNSRGSTDIQNPVERIKSSILR
jgi:hypothetical protein